MGGSCYDMRLRPQIFDKIRDNDVTLLSTFLGHIC